MPQHRNAVSRKPRALLFTSFFSLVVSILCYKTLGQAQELEERPAEPHNELAAVGVQGLPASTTASTTSIPFVVAAAQDSRLRAGEDSIQPHAQETTQSSEVTTAIDGISVRSPSTARAFKKAAEHTGPSSRCKRDRVLSIAARLTVVPLPSGSVASSVAASLKANATSPRPTIRETVSPTSPAAVFVGSVSATTQPSVKLPAWVIANGLNRPLSHPLASLSAELQARTAGPIPPEASGGQFPNAHATLSSALPSGTAAPASTVPSTEAAVTTAAASENGKPLSEKTVDTREHLKRALCRKYYKFVLGVHSAYHLDTLDCEYRPEPGSYIAEKVKEIPLQKDAAQARLDRIEAIRRLQRDAEANPTDRVIVEWDTTCLKELPTLIKDHVVEETEDETSVFDAYELNGSSEQVVLKRGVYLRDRIGNKEKADPEVRQVLKGREYALAVIANSLGLQVSKRAVTRGGAAAAAAAATGEPSPDTASASEEGAHGFCERDYKKVLQDALLDVDVPTIEAAHYSKLGVDVLHIKNLKRRKQEWNIIRASEIPALVVRLAQEQSLSLPPAETPPVQSPAGFEASGVSASEAFATATRSQMHRRSVEAAKHVVSCILKVSDDQKREVQSFRGPSTPPVSETYSSGDPEQPRQWHLHSYLGNYTLWADLAWPELAGKPGNPVADSMIVAVLDTGCFIHQDFIDGFDIENSRFWVNKGETDCENHIDDDGNGYVDDCFGWDFVGDQAYPFVDDLGHGTSVTSVLAARHSDALGGRGIISTGKIMCLRVGGRDGIWLSDTIPALDYALRMGAKVSNHSYGGKGFDQAEFSAFRRASQADHLAVTAAGNSGCDIDKDESCLFTPGAFDLDGILNVGANDVAGYRTSFSNYGKKGVDVFAPGKSIFVGTNKAPNNVGKTCKHCYEFIDGTSFAAPMVSGIAAALWTHFEITQPIGWVVSTQKKSLRVKEAIMYSVVGSRGLAGAGRVNGVVNFYKALHYYDTVPSAYSPDFPDPPNGYQPQNSSSLKGFPNPLLIMLMLAAIIYSAC